MSWEFDSGVADIFSSHARKHIPDYDKVLQLSIDLCRDKALPDSPILEIGCAVGATIDLLHQQSFTNIHAVDNSEHMLKKCNPDIAQYYCSDAFPETKIKFDAVICNWTLHFIKNKKAYLKQIRNSMAPNGFLILTEKTENSGISLQRYHEFKKSCGVSEQEINEKARSLEGVMFIDTVDWYFKNLKNVGFKKINVINATWCFTTFLATL